MTLAVGSRGPRHRAHRVEIRHQQQIAIDVEAIVVDLAVVARHALDEDRFGNAQVLPQELAGRKELAAGDAGNVGNNRFDFVDAMIFEPLFDITRHRSPARHGTGASLPRIAIDPNETRANTSTMPRSEIVDVSVVVLHRHRARVAASRTRSARVASMPTCVLSAPGTPDLSAALHLAQAGKSVVVLEAQRIGWGASGRNGGQLFGGQRQDVDWLEAHYGPVAGAPAVGSRRSREATRQTTDLRNSQSTAS